MSYKSISILALLICSLVFCVYQIYMLGYDNANNEWQQKWDAAQVATLALQQQKQQKIDEVTEDAEKEIQRVQADAIAANHAADSLRGTVSNLRQRLNSETSRAGKAEASAANLFAELLVQSDKMAGDFASFADEARERGLACERAYDAVRAVK